VEQQIDVVQTTGHVKTGIVNMAQELKPPGGRRSWRDEARFRLQQALGGIGETLGEGLLGESEEEKYLEFLQREYGSELPRDEEGNIDVPLSRPMREAMLDPSDLGMADKTLMILSGGGSLFPRAALGAGGLESGMLMGDAKAMIDRGETVPGAVTAALAGLPPAVAAAANKQTFADLGKDAVSGIGQFMKENVPSIQRNVMTTPEGVDVPLYFSRGSGNMTGGGSGMKNQEKINKLIERKEKLIKDHEAMTERMPPDQARRMFPKEEIDDIDEQIYDLTEATQLKTQRLMETADTETGSRTLNDPMFDRLTESEQANLLKTQNLMRQEKIDELGRDLYTLRSELNQEGHLMSVRNLTKLQNKIAELEAEIKSLRR
jgi:hypothetical protein